MYYIFFTLYKNEVYRYYVRNLWKLFIFFTNKKNLLEKNIFKCENWKIHSCNTFIYTKNDIFYIIIHNNKIRDNKDSEK